VLVFEYLELHSCYTSSVHSYLRSILTAVAPGWFYMGWFVYFERFGVSILISQTTFLLYIIRPFLPTVHIDGGGARLVLSGLVCILREIWC
jgi:hypothetical protein